MHANHLQTKAREPRLRPLSLNRESYGPTDHQTTDLRCPRTCHPSQTPLWLSLVCVGLTGPWQALLDRLVRKGPRLGSWAASFFHVKSLCGTSVTGSSPAVSRDLISRAAWKVCHLPPLLTHPQLWRTGAFKEIQYAPSCFKKCAWPQICNFLKQD